MAQLGLTIAAVEEAEMDNAAIVTGNPANGPLTQAVELWRHALPRLVGPELYVLKTAVKHHVMLLVEQSKHCAFIVCPTADLTCSGRDLGNCSGRDLGG